MEYVLSKHFEKQFAKLPRNVKTKALVAFEMFVEDPEAVVLRNHALAGTWNGYRSINMTGNVRAVYTQVNKAVVRFVAIGTHGELYGL